MSKLEQLINELCPDGVEWKKILDICDVSRGVVISKDDIRNQSGEYPVYSSQTENDGELGRINTYSYNGEYLTWTTDGANAGTVFYRTDKFNVTNVCGLLKVKDSKNSIRFIYHVLRVEALKYVRSGMGNPKLMSNVMGSIQIPLPPLPIQEEIVRILDNFTELTAEFTAELTARKKQYEYYRDSLLTFEEGHVEWKHLKEVALEFGRGKSKHRPRNDSKLYGGITPFIQTGDIKRAPHIIRQFTQTYSKFGLEQSKLWPKGTLCITIAANIAETAILGFDSCFPDSVIGFVANPEKTNSSYVEYLLTLYKLKLQSKSTGCAQENINLATFESLLLPFPPLPEQQRIVDILDRFDILCNDISSGLPAEIEARKKQYEYYRDKLLTFPKLDIEG